MLGGDGLWRAVGVGVRCVLARGGLTMGSGRVAVLLDVLAYCVSF